MSFQILNARQIAAAKRAGGILRACLDEMAGAVKPGMTTGELDRLAEAFIVGHPGATPAFKGYHNYPATLCTSVNDECVHGLPGPRVLHEGDIISIDCGVIVEGIYTDACVTVPVGQIPADVQSFLERSSESLEMACELVAPGRRIGDISHAIQRHVERHGYSCVYGLTGHGLGTSLHLFPDIPNTGKAGTGPVLPAHALIAIEPITSMGGERTTDMGDGWTIKTADGSRSAHFEHTVLVTEGGCEILA